MCRLFGFRSVIFSQVHESLVGADNALESQSGQHPDGWGVAYYVSGAPHIVKSEKTAVEDGLFKKVSGVVSSETVVAHLRKATLGTINILNTHPFQFGNWVFAHNGNIKNFDKHKANIKSKIAPALQRYILGETDSELIFFTILNHLSSMIPLNRPDCSIDLLAKATQDTIKELREEIGDFSPIDDAGPEETYLTFLITNGATMLAHHGGKDLFYSTYKNRCGERDTCPSFTEECENPTRTGHINHLIFSSEKLSGNNIWIPVAPGQLVGADWQMKLKFY